MRGTSRPTAQKTSKPVAYVKAVYEMSELVLLRVLNPWLMNDFIFSLTGHGFRWKHSLKVLIGMGRTQCCML